MARGAAACAAAVLLWLLAIASGWQPLFQAAIGLFVLVLLCAGWVANSLWGLGFQRPSPVTRAQVGQILRDEQVLTNRAPLPKFGIMLRDHSTLPGHRASSLLNVGPKRKREQTVQTVSELRGLYTLGPTGAVASDPFGLFTVERRLSPASSVLVYPETVDLGEFGVPGTLIAEGRRHLRPTQVQTVDPAGTRPYVYGDSVRRIHWLSSAHAGQLMVKEFEHSPAADVWIFLDLQSAPHVGTGLHSTEEYGVTAAASVTAHFLRAGRAVGLVASGQPYQVLPPDRGERQLLRALELLAVVKANGRVPLHEILSAERSRLHRAATALVITPSTDEGWAGVLAQVGHAGTRAATLLLEASTFGEAPPVTMQVAALTSAGIPTSLIKRGPTMKEALAVALGVAARRQRT